MVISTLPLLLSYYGYGVGHVILAKYVAVSLLQVMVWSQAAETCMASQIQDAASALHRASIKTLQTCVNGKLETVSKH